MKFIWLLSNFIWVYLCVTLLAMVVFIILPMKAIFGRDRPTRNKSVYRLCNMRDVEGSQKSMPSGDAAACAFICSAYWYLFGNKWFVIICLPFVSLGRVYVHCHWIGDTILGSIIGLYCAHVCFGHQYFPILSQPFVEAIFQIKMWMI